MLDAIRELFNAIADALTRSTSLDVGAYDVFAVAAIGLVSLACGLVGPFVIGNRMAFFSDAMAHTAFAGVALGVLTMLLTAPLITAQPKGDPTASSAIDMETWIIPAVMVAFGIAVGLGIAFVRERTSLGSDAVIGVFFALAIGFAAMLIPALNTRRRFDAEQFLFGSALFATPADIAFLLFVVLLSGLFVVFRFNAMTLAGFNPSLARTRNVSVRLNNYLFIVLLSLVVNLSIRAVGVLLINALLIVPAAAAANLARNVRQLFAYSLLLSVACSLGGYFLSNLITVPMSGSRPIQFGPGGTIVVLCVLTFFATAMFAAVRGRRIHGVDDSP